MSQSRTFMCPLERYTSLVNATQHWMLSENFECQRLNTDDGGTLLQIQKRGDWRKAVGMSTALNVVFRHVGSSVNVEIGSGRWIDKGAVATISLFVLWPLAITAAVGAWGQMQMPERVFNQIANLLVQA